MDHVLFLFRKVHREQVHCPRMDGALRVVVGTLDDVSLAVIAFDVDGLDRFRDDNEERD